MVRSASRSNMDWTTPKGYVKEQRSFLHRLQDCYFLGPTLGWALFIVIMPHYLFSPHSKS